MVDDERRRGVADAAGAMVALEDPFPPAAEAGAGAAAAVVAVLAQPASVEVRRSAGAAQRQLDLAGGGHEQSAGFSPAREARRRVGRPRQDASVEALLRA